MNQLIVSTLKLSNGDELMVHSLQDGDEGENCFYAAEPRLVTFNGDTNLVLSSYAKTAQNQAEVVARLPKDIVVVACAADEDYAGFYMQSIGVQMEQETPQIITEAPIGFDPSGNETH